MKNRSSILIPATLLLGLAVLISSCQKIQKLFVKPPPEGVVQESSTIRLSCYEQTIMVEASTQEVIEFLSDPSNLFISGIDTEQGLPSQLMEGRLELGSAFPFNVSRMGITIKGRMIVVKFDENSLWMIWENPMVLQIQRWQFKQTPEGTSVNLKVETEVPQQGVLASLEKVGQLTGLTEQVSREIDLMLADIQSHFDPSLDPNELVAMGLRGDNYETMLQMHSSSIWIDAEPDEVLEWSMRDRKNLEAYMPLKIGGEYLEPFLDFLQSTRNDVFYCPSVYQLGGLTFDVDLFTVKRARPGSHRLYWVSYGEIAGYLQMSIIGEAGGSRAESAVVFEMPGSSTPRLMDILLVLTGFSKQLDVAAMDIKQGVESSRPAN